MKKRLLAGTLALSVIFLTAIATFALEITYTYDNLNRLTSALYTEGSNTTTLNYQYDQLGNITTYAVGDGTTAGTVQVNSEPNEANGSWTLTGPDSYSQNGTGDQAISGLTPGSYSITWNDTTGWIKPSPSSETKALAAGTTVSFAGSYTAVPPPVVDPETPVTGLIGSQITINGSNFGDSVGSGYVDFNGVHTAAADIVSWSNTQIVVKIPVGATTGCMKVYNASGGSSNCYNFTINIDSYSYITQWGSLGSATNQFNTPMALAIDGTGNVYVTDRNNHRVLKFSSSGTYITHWGGYGSTDGKFNQPDGISLDSQGNIYVADTINHRIQKFTSTGVFIAKWGSQGSTDGRMAYPEGLVVDRFDNVYVADWQNHRIQKFSNTGTFLGKWGSSGSGDGQFQYPTHIAADLSGNVYVADRHNHRIQKFSSTGEFITKWGTNGTGDGQFNEPCGITLDQLGNVYVTDAANHRIQKFTSTGVFITKWGSNGTANSQFDYPIGIVVDSSDNVYVADVANHRIQKFGPAVPIAGSVAIHPEPVEMDTTATWTLTGPNDFSQSGTGAQTINNLPAGNYTLTWGDMDGWTKPASETKSVTQGGTTTFTGIYTYSTGNVSGTVNYTGKQSGTLKVAAYGDANLTTIVGQLFSINWPGSSTSYDLTGLTAGTYYVGAFIDGGTTNAAPASTEAQGSYPGPITVSTGGVTGKDFTLYDPETNSNTLPDWWEINYGGSLGSLGNGSDDYDHDGYSNLAEYQNGTDPTGQDAPNGNGYDPSKDNRLYDISGVITYGGTQTGILKVAAYAPTDTNFETPIGAIQNIWSGASQNYTISAPNGIYVVGAFIDSGTTPNGLRDVSEAQGNSAQLTVSGASITQDVALEEVTHKISFTGKAEMGMNAQSIFTLKSEIPAGKTLKAFNVEVHYDSTKLTLVPATAPSTNPAKSISCPTNLVPININTSTAGTVVFNGFNATGQTGPLAFNWLDFAFAGKGVQGTTIITIVVNGYGANEAEQFKPSVETFTLNLVPYARGDADGSGSVDIFDALIVAEYDALLKTQNDLTGFAVADVDGSGSVDIFDALKISEYDAGLIPNLE